ncbi:hypothetical protein [Halorussus pelagicus]|uniref:hypothetical protein n=1 Tax=Halorussus pelagicus TaxID=2505977 RepID=UPI000FFC50D7|nr:hypothetical protein [Halorussus pelagicus]
MTADEYDTGERTSPSDRAAGGDAGCGVPTPVGSRDCFDADRIRGPTGDPPARRFGTEMPSGPTSEELLYV